MQVGNLLKIDFDVESREYNGKWYTDVKAWKVEQAGGGSAFNENPPPSVNEIVNGPEDDLPF